MASEQSETEQDIYMNETRTNQGNAESGLLTKLFRFLVHDAFSFTVSIVGLVHVALLVLFLIADVIPMVIVNCISVAIYIVCFILSRMDHIVSVYTAVIIEVTGYAIISTYFIGLRCGTYCFLFSIVPIIIYFGCILLKGMKRLIVVVTLLMNFVTFAVLYSVFYKVEPLYKVDQTMMVILVVFSAFVMVFSTMFYNAMYIFSSENTVTTLEKRNKQLSMDAHEDALTNLLNRRGFLPLVKSLMYTENSGKFCIAFCDLDDFKRVNDSYGHEAGDEVLKHTITIIEKELPGCDICRWGGEEFVILLKDCDILQAKSKVERLRKTIESNPTNFCDKQIFVTTTIGIEEYKDSYSEPEIIIKKADERMYYGKQHGKNILVYEDAV